MNNDFNVFDNQNNNVTPAAPPTPPTPPIDNASNLEATGLQGTTPTTNEGIVKNEEIQLNSDNLNNNVTNDNIVNNNVTNDNISNNTSNDNQPNLNNIKIEDKPVTPIDNNQLNTQINNNGFVPNVPTEEKKTEKKNIKPVIIGVSVLVICLLLGYFVIYPFVQKKFMSDPKNVFDTTIKNTSKNMNDFIADVNLESALYDFNFKYDTNIESLKQFSGYTYGVKYGFDTKNEALEASLYMNDSTNKNHNLGVYLKDKKSFLKLSSYNDLIFMADENENEITTYFEEIRSMLNSQISNEEMSYLIDKFSSLIIESIDENRLSKEDAVIKINGEDVEVTKNIYNIDKDTLEKTENYIIDGLVKDKKTLKTLAKILEVEENKVKETLTSSDEEDEVDTVEDVNINAIIYTSGKKSDVIGYEMQSDNKTVISYLFNDKGFNLLIDASEEETNGIEVNENAKAVIKINGTKNGNKTDVEVLYNDKKYVTLKVSQFDEKAIKFSYIIDFDGQNVNGDVDLTMNNDNNGSNDKLQISLNSGSDKITAYLNMYSKNNAKIADIDVNSAKTLSEDELNNVFNDFILSLKDTPIGYLYSTIDGLIDKNSYDNLNM